MYEQHLLLETQRLYLASSVRPSLLVRVFCDHRLISTRNFSASTSNIPIPSADRSKYTFQPTRRNTALNDKQTVNHFVTEFPTSYDTRGVIRQENSPPLKPVFNTMQLIHNLTPSFSTSTSTVLCASQLVHPPFRSSD